jgi:hypothetical protein
LEELLLNNNEPYLHFPVAFVAYSSDISSIPKAGYIDIQRQQQNGNVVIIGPFSHVSTTYCPGKASYDDDDLEEKDGSKSAMLLA